MSNLVKRFRFRSLPPIPAQPAAWAHHLLAEFPECAALPPMDPEEGRAALAAHMPELLPEFDLLMGHLEAHPWAPRALAMYNLPPFFGGCSVTVAKGAGRTTLLRNYDLGPDDHSGVIRCEALAGGGWILGSADCGWGYMDGINDRGLAAAITFGGRFTVGEGFVVPVIVRYLLHTCSTAAEAAQTLERLPHRLVQNFILLDRHGSHAVVHTSPDRGVTVQWGQICTTNHQGQVDVPGHARFVRTVERFHRLADLAGEITLADLLRPPFYQQRYAEHFGTVYTVELDPAGRTARYAWPGREALFGPDSPETEWTVTYQQAAG